MLSFTRNSLFFATFFLSLVACDGEPKVEEQNQNTDKDVALKYPGFCLKSELKDSKATAHEERTWKKSDNGIWLPFEEKKDLNGDKEWNVAYMMKYDAMDILIEVQKDDAINDTIDSVFSYVYASEADQEFNISNAPIGELSRVVEHKADSEEVISYRGFLYSEKGLLVRSTLGSGDEEEQIRESTEFEYNENGQLSEQEYDSNGDGTPDLILKFHYLDLNQIEKVEVDSDADGNVDGERTYKYDEIGNLLEIKDSSNQSQTLFNYDCWDDLIS